MKVRELIEKLEQVEEELEVHLAFPNKLPGETMAPRLVYEVCYVDDEHDDVVVISA